MDFFKLNELQEKGNFYDRKGAALNAGVLHALENGLAFIAITYILFLRKGKITVFTMLNSTLSWVMLNKFLGTAARF